MCIWVRFYSLFVASLHSSYGLQTPNMWTRYILSPIKEYLYQFTIRFGTITVMIIHNTNRTNTTQSFVSHSQFDSIWVFVFWWKRSLRNLCSYYFVRVFAIVCICLAHSTRFIFIKHNPSRFLFIFGLYRSICMHNDTAKNCIPFVTHTHTQCPFFCLGIMLVVWIVYAWHYTYTLHSQHSIHSLKFALINTIYKL